MTCLLPYAVVPVHSFTDNYIWVLRDERHAVVVDPSDARAVLEYLGPERQCLAAILTTHHHADHAGGIEELLRHRDAPVYCPTDEPIETLSHKVGEGDRVEIAELSARFDVIDVPGDTCTYIAYYGANALLCGDRLFAGGCGRMYEVTCTK